MEKPKYDWIDGVFSLFFICLMFFGYVLLMNLYFDIGRYGRDISDSFLLVSQLGFGGFFLLLIAVFLKIRKQKWSSVGLTSKNGKKSLRLGLFYSVVFIIVFLIIHWIKGDISIQSDWQKTLDKALYFLIVVAFFEEVTFRGFINSRLKGLIKNQTITIILTALFFSLMHMPFKSMSFEGDVMQYFAINGTYHIILCFVHVIFQHFFDQHNNILAPGIMHFSFDFFQWFLIGIE
ncbi:MAG: CPBP family intramembrane glutamic endopeptidase [Candidatus Izemoplasmatales bacterium]|jgi:hypothetical protein